MTAYYPKIDAVDPSGCGCTECLIGEYVPWDVWTQNATVEDVTNFINGTVRNNTYNDKAFLEVHQNLNDFSFEVQNWFNDTVLYLIQSLVEDSL